MRTIDNCYQKCVSHFCCWRWYTITTKTTTTTNFVKRDLPRWSLLAVVIAVEPLLKFDWNSIKSHCFQFWFLLFLHTQRQNDFLLLRLHQCPVCYENVRLYIVCCFFRFIFSASLLNRTLVHRLYFLIIPFDAMFAFFFVVLTVALLWCFCTSDFVRLFFSLPSSITSMHSASLHMLLFLWLVVSMLKWKRSKTIYFCRPIYFPSTQP